MSNRFKEVLGFLPFKKLYEEIKKANYFVYFVQNTRNTSLQKETFLQSALIPALIEKPKEKITENKIADFSNTVLLEGQMRNFDQMRNSLASDIGTFSMEACQAALEKLETTAKEEISLNERINFEDLALFSIDRMMFISSPIRRASVFDRNMLLEIGRIQESHRGENKDEYFKLIEADLNLLLENEKEDVKNGVGNSVVNLIRAQLDGNRFETQRSSKMINITYEMYQAANSQDLPNRIDLKYPVGFELETFSLLPEFSGNNEEVRTKPFLKKKQAVDFLENSLNYITEANKDLAANDENYAFATLHVNIGLTKNQIFAFKKHFMALQEIFSLCAAMSVPYGRSEKKLTSIDRSACPLGNFNIAYDITKTPNANIVARLECKPFALEDAGSTPPEFILAFSQFAGSLLDQPQAINNTLKILRALQEDTFFCPYWEREKYFDSQGWDSSNENPALGFFEKTFNARSEFLRRELMPSALEFMTDFTNQTDNQHEMEKVFASYRKSNRGSVPDEITLEEHEIKHINSMTSLKTCNEISAQHRQVDLLDNIRALPRIRSRCSGLML